MTNQLNTAQLRHPFYTIYLCHGGKPSKKHYELGAALQEAHRLAAEFDRVAFVTEWKDKPLTICRVLPTGEMVEM